MGRPSKLTPERSDAICKLIAEGVPQEHSAHAAGVDPSTIRLWVKKGREADDPPDKNDVKYVAFIAALTRAREEAVTFYVNAVREAVLKGDSRAAQWWLERRVSDLFGMRQTVDLEAGPPVRIIVEGW